nr:protein MAIN-LIKE 2-like [Arachis hypogaea]
MRRQQGMRLDERYVRYLQMASLYHLAKLNESSFKLDEPLVSAFVERWRPEIHMFYMLFGKCMITLQDVAYQLGLRINGYYKFTVNYSWFQETFGELPDGADEPTIRRYAQAYIMMLLGTQLFGDKYGTHIHIRWLLYVARLENMGGYSWRLAALSWLYRCMYHVEHFVLGGTPQFAYTIAPQAGARPSMPSPHVLRQDHLGHPHSLHNRMMQTEMMTRCHLHRDARGSDDPNAASQGHICSNEDEYLGVSVLFMALRSFHFTLTLS